jgi:hypothetical protein
MIVEGNLTGVKGCEWGDGYEVECFCYDVAIPFGVSDTSLGGENVGCDEGRERVGI